MEPLLALADELERRDRAVEERLTAVEHRRAEIEELRGLVDRAAQAMDELPGRRAEQRRAEAAALEERDRAAAALAGAEAALARAKKDAERIAAEREVATARAEVEAAERWIAEASEQRDRLDEDERRSAEHASAAVDHVRRLGGDPPPRAAGGREALSAVADWVARERGALLVAHSGLAREREAIVREASELLGSVLGEPLAATSVAGLRGRLRLARGGT